MGFPAGVVTRHIKPSCERTYEELVKGIHEAINIFLAENAPAYVL